MTHQEILIAAGMDYDKTLKRFSGNAGMVERFAKKFPTDPSFSQLTVAMTERRYDEAELAAHTLKGVAANLGFQHLSNLTEEVVEHLRTGALDEAGIAFTAVSADYTRACKCLERIE